MNNADLTVSVRVLWKHRTHRLYGSCECMLKGWKYKALSPRAAAAAGAESLPTLKEQSAATWLHTWNSEDWSLHLSGASSASASWASGLMLRDTSPSGCHTFLGLSQSIQVDNQPTLTIILFHYVIEKKGRSEEDCPAADCHFVHMKGHSDKVWNNWIALALVLEGFFFFSWICLESRNSCQNEFLPSVLTWRIE